MAKLKIKNSSGTWEEIVPSRALAADTAGSCTGNSATATKATQDGSGNTITSTYLTKTDASNTYLGKSANAASATKATQDGSGNTITSTYAKLSGATFTGAVKATSFQATSDSRFKFAIEPVKYRYALNALNSINSYSYKLKGDTLEGKRFGVIAQEVLEVLPEVVKQDEEEYYSVDYAGLTAICVAAINELTVRVQFLERQLAEINKQ